MNRRAGASIVLLTILVMVALALAGGLFYFFQEEHKKNLALQDELTRSTTQYERIRSELEEAKKKVSVLTDQMKETQGKIDTLTVSLEEEKSARIEAQAKKEELRYEFDQQKSLRINLETKLSDLQEVIKDKEVQIKELSSQKSELEEQMKAVKQSESQRVELGTIVVSPEETVSAKSRAAAIVKDVAPAKAPQFSSEVLEGKVLVVNKNYNFVVINLGIQDGITVGSEFSVYRKKQFLGDLKIEKVHDSMSAAGFLTDGLSYKLNEGDRVVQKIR